VVLLPSSVASRFEALHGGRTNGTGRARGGDRAAAPALV
jgi:hypothetical protein